MVAPPFSANSVVPKEEPGVCFLAFSAANSLNATFSAIHRDRPFSQIDGALDVREPAVGASLPAVFSSVVLPVIPPVNPGESVCLFTPDSSPWPVRPGTTIRGGRRPFCNPKDPATAAPPIAARPRSPDPIQRAWRARTDYSPVSRHETVPLQLDVDLIRTGNRF